MNDITASLSRVVPMTKWICRWKPFWIPHGDTFQKALRNGNRKTIPRDTPVPATTRPTTPRHFRLPKQQRLKAYKDPRMTDGAPHVRYQLLQAVLPYSNRLGNLTRIQTRQRSSQRLQKPVFAILFIRYSLASFPNDYLCRIPMMGFYRATRKTSRPYETVFQLG